MEDNNQISKARKAWETVKKVGKKLFSKLPKKVKKYIIIGLAGLLAILIIAGIPGALAELVIAVITSPIKALLNFLMPEQQKMINEKYGDLIETASATTSMVTIGEQGQYLINDEKAELVIKMMESLGVSNEAIGYDTEEYGNMIDKYIKTEMATLYPKTNAPGNEMEGSIIIKRQFINTGTVKNLIYEKWSTFKDRKDTDAINYFSINPDTLELCIAEYGNSIEYRDNNNNKIASMSSSEDITIKPYKYQNLVQGYSLPYNFLIILHQYTQDIKFMNEIVDDILNQYEPIVITFVDSSTSIIEEINYQGKKNLKYEIIPEGIIDDIQYQYAAEITQEELETLKIGSITIDNTNVKKFYTDAKEYVKRIETTNSVSMYVTKADTLFRKSEKIVEVQSNPHGTDQLSGSTPIYNSKSIVARKVSDTDKIALITTEYILTENSKTKAEGNVFTVIDKEAKIKVNEFVDLIKNNYPGVKDKLESSAYDIFYHLQQNENTQQHEKIMRYVISQLDGTPYDVNELDLEYLFQDGKLYQTISSKDFLKRYYRKFINYVPETITIDGERYYVVGEDGIVGYGVDVNHFSGLYSIGDKIPIEDVDNKEEEIVLNRRNEIKVLLFNLNLESYQINALTIRSFDFEDDPLYGLGGFEELYTNTAYWNPETDNKFEEEAIEPDYNVKLYTDFWIQPVNPSTIAKRKSEWILFQTGYYDRLGEREPKVSAERILEMCEEVMNDLLNHNVHYSQSRLAWNDIESSNDFSKYGCCCATYVSVILYRIGIFEPDYINKYAYNSVSGVESMLNNAKWIQVRVEDAQPGDICCYPRQSEEEEGHTFIYAGGNEIWDQRSGCISSGGGEPYRGTGSRWNTYKNKRGITVWRMP